MTSRERVIQALHHESPDRIPVDIGSSPTTGIHILAVENLRKYYGLDLHPIKVIEPYQMLGEMEEDLMRAMGIDVTGLWGHTNMFGIRQEGWRPMRTFWGQEILVPRDFNTTTDQNGDLLMYPEGDTGAPPSARMPKEGFFFDAIIRQEPIDEAALDPEDNLEEFSVLSEEDIAYWKQQAQGMAGSDRAVMATFGGTAIGDIGLVPAMQLKHPKGIRDIAEWYMSTVMRTDYLHRVFEKQTDIALENLEKLYAVVGESVQVVFICGTDFGTQNSTFCSTEQFDELYAPYYKKMNSWIHAHTGWKTFKHCCGAVESLMSHFIDSGFDIINPVQINAAGMDPGKLKQKYGDHLVFWGGGVDTQHVLPFETPEKVREHVLNLCGIFSPGGGFVFNTVHNIQANVPVENLVAMIDAVKEFNQ